MEITLRLFRNFLAWLTLGGLAVLSLLLLNSALFSAWMSYGPPNPFPEGWALRSQMLSIWALAAAAGAGPGFSAIRRFPVLGLRLKLLLAGVALLSLLPFLLREWRIDQCLDQGDRWNRAGLQCERKAP